MPYLQELGITGIWMDPPSLQESRHFYNMWCRYGVMEPDKFDPILGPEEQLKTLVEEAHRLRHQDFSGCEDSRCDGLQSVGQRTP